MSLSCGSKFRMKRTPEYTTKFHCGSLEYTAKEKARHAHIFETVPTIVDVYLDRLAILPEIAACAAVLLVCYGSGGEAFLDVMFGVAPSEGKLPFDLSSSIKAVEESRLDVEDDTKNLGMDQHIARIHESRILEVCRFDYR